MRFTPDWKQEIFSTCYVCRKNKVALIAVFTSYIEVEFSSSEFEPENELFVWIDNFKKLDLIEEEINSRKTERLELWDKTWIQKPNPKTYVVFKSDRIRKKAAGASRLPGFYGSIVSPSVKKAWNYYLKSHGFDKSTRKLPSKP